MSGHERRAKYLLLAPKSVISSQVWVTTSEEMQDPFLAARWVARRVFHSLVCKEHPVTCKSGKAQKGGRISSWEAPGAKHRKFHNDSRSATDDSDSRQVGGMTILRRSTDISSSTAAPERSRNQGGKGKSNTYTWQATQREHEAATMAGQTSSQNRPSPFPVMMKDKKGHKQDRSLSSTHDASNEGQRKRHSGPDHSKGSDLTSADKSTAPKNDMAKAPASSTCGSKVSVAGADTLRRIQIQRLSPTSR